MPWWKSVTECALHREDVTFNHVLWAPLQGKWLRMSKSRYRVGMMVKKPPVFCHRETTKLSMVPLTAHKSSLPCSGFWKPAAFYSGRGYLGLSSDDPLRSSSLVPLEVRRILCRSGICRVQWLYITKVQWCFGDCPLAVLLIFCITWMQIISQVISTALNTAKNCVTAKLLKIPRDNSLPRLVSRLKEQHMLAFRDDHATMALLLPVAKEGNVVLV